MINNQEQKIKNVAAVQAQKLERFPQKLKLMQKNVSNIVAKRLSFSTLYKDTKKADSLEHIPQPLNVVQFCTV